MRFRFSVIGSSERPVMEIAVDSMTELNSMMEKNRFVEGYLVKNEDGDCRVEFSLATNRILSHLVVCEED